jgi:hypothetical protein
MLIFASDVAATNSAERRQSLPHRISVSLVQETRVGVAHNNMQLTSFLKFIIEL